MTIAGIVTINDGGNYGNRLQNYALSMILSRRKFKVITINTYDNCNSRQRYVLRRVKNVLRSIERLLLSKRSLAYSRLCSFSRFTAKYVPDNRAYLFSAKGITSCREKIDFIVLGSDQIWNPNFISSECLKLRLGAFASGGHIFSYAASFGVSEIIGNDIRDIFKTYLPRISAISVREDRGKELVKELSGQDATVVLDPTLMLGAVEWLKITKGFVPENDRYILTYFLGKPSPEQGHIIQAKARELGCRVRRILDENDPETYVAGPEDFVELFSKAQYVFADSYHACCFSILFHKQFTVFNRAGMAGKSNMNSRMETLFRLFNLDSVMMDSGLAPEIDYVKVDQLLEQHRKESQDWLDKTLKE